MCLWHLRPARCPRPWVRFTRGWDHGWHFRDTTVLHFFITRNQEIGAGRHHAGTTSVLQFSRPEDATILKRSKRFKHKNQMKSDSQLNSESNSQLNSMLSCDSDFWGAVRHTRRMASPQVALAVSRPWPLPLTCCARKPSGCQMAMATGNGCSDCSG